MKRREGPPAGAGRLNSPQRPVSSALSSTNRTCAASTPGENGFGRKFVPASDAKERWAKSRKRPVLRRMGVDQIYLGKTQEFLTVVSILETGEALWFGQVRKRKTLDEFFRKGGRPRGLVRSKRWLLLSRWVNLNSERLQLLNELFRLNRTVVLRKTA